MSNYDITVLYAYRDSKENKIADFPAQTFPADKVEIIPVEENNLIFPRQNYSTCRSDNRNKRISRT